MIVPTLQRVCSPIHLTRLFAPPLRTPLFSRPPSLWLGSALIAACLIGWGAALPALAHPLCLTGPAPSGNPAVQQICDGDPLDSNPATGAIQFHFSGQGVETSGTLISPETGATSFTSPPQFAVPSGYDPQGLFTNAMWIVGYANDSAGQLLVSHTNLYPNAYDVTVSIPLGIAGYVYFPFTFTGSVYLSLTGEFGSAINSTNINIINAGAGYYSFSTGIVPSVAVPGRNGPFNLLGTLDFHFFGGTAAIFLPNSADLLPTVVPEPATLALLGVALAGLGFSRRRKPH